jgi:hypothetical protein
MVSNMSSYVNKIAGQTYEIMSNMRAKNHNHYFKKLNKRLNYIGGVKITNKFLVNFFLILINCINILISNVRTG